MLISVWCSMLSIDGAISLCNERETETVRACDWLSGCAAS
jgi:hypothetical protein